MPDDLESSRPEHVVLVIWQSLRGRDDDRVTGVRAKRVEVLHVAADDSVLARQAKVSTEAHSRSWDGSLHQQRHEQLRTQVLSILSFTVR